MAVRTLKPRSSVSPNKKVVKRVQSAKKSSRKSSPAKWTQHLYPSTNAALGAYFLSNLQSPTKEDSPRKKGLQPGWNVPGLGVAKSSGMINETVVVTSPSLV